MVCLARHGAGEPEAVVGSGPLKERSRGDDEVAGLANVEEAHIDGARGGFLITVLVFEAAFYGVDIEEVIAALLGYGVSEKKGKEWRRSRTR